MRWRDEEQKINYEDVTVHSDKTTLWYGSSCNVPSSGSDVHLNVFSYICFKS